MIGRILARQSHFPIFMFAQSKFNSYKDVAINNSEITKTYMRASGPGGQSVNTTNSKVEVRLPISMCSAIDETVATNLRNNYGNFINKAGEIVLRSQVHKSQGHNLSECIQKLQKMIFNCSHVPKERRYEIAKESEEMEEQRIEGKRKRSEVKSRRNLIL